MSEIRSQATPARDSGLTDALRDAVGDNYDHGRNPNLTGQLWHEDGIRDSIDWAGAARDLEREGWSKPRTVNDVDQLEALPAGTVLRNNKSGRVFEKARDKGAGKSKWMRMQDRWVYETYEILNESTWTVLFTPGDAG
ncbi:MAG: hypothetical protein WA972_21155 [Rhodococcus qingshengii]